MHSYIYWYLSIMLTLHRCTCTYMYTCLDTCTCIYAISLTMHVHTFRRFIQHKTLVDGCMAFIPVSPTSRKLVAILYYHNINPLKLHIVMEFLSDGLLKVIQIDYTWKRVEHILSDMSNVSPVTCILVVKLKHFHKGVRVIIQSWYTY